MPQPRILVTGATGFIGRALCERLADRRTWTALGRTPPAETMPVGFQQVDLTKPLPAGIIPKDTDVLVHLAAYRGASSDVTGHFRGTAAATLNLCEAARRAGVRRVVLASSTSVYEPALPASRTLQEEDRRIHARPLADAFAKKWAEDAARLQALLAEPQSMLWILRPGLVVGPGMRSGSWVRSTIRRILAGEPYPLTGERGHHLGLVALDDAIEGFIHAIGAEPPPYTEKPGPIWNLVSEVWWERDVITALAEAVGVEPRFVPPATTDPVGWSEQPLSIAGDGGRWIRESGGKRTRPIRPLLEALARAERGA